MSDMQMLETAVRDARDQLETFAQELHRIQEDVKRLWLQVTGAGRAMANYLRAVEVLDVLEQRVRAEDSKPSDGAS